ncbi:hypothetical protein DNTS_017297 [Danionella cerebrum]|uniref:protein-tyrosine-phosphatase n=1 Tax=Danionella cerebrum TaxID=2873325 RepID=A0A553MYB5_9TELE|nr:hypothetical protein DNTS_017297 [Danionella translucida]
MYGDMEHEFQEIDSEARWQNLYLEIRNQSQECAFKVAKYPENRTRNRYRDVSPFDHSRVKLENMENDYINASLVVMEEAQRRYILTQGPLRNTCSHFWLMIWEQKTKAIIMLNRIIEKGSTGETREIHHFHYTTWPDFGVPESPASFLNFLFKVRESGTLEMEQGPAVVHCSAGIGRSGTFSLVDTCLVLMDKRKDPLSVDIKKILLDMRKFRMGLIQTPDQLRFSYMAVLEGAKYIMGDPSKQWRELSKEDQEPLSESPPPPQPPKFTERYNGSKLSRLEDGMESKSGRKMETTNKEPDRDAGTQARKRSRDEKVSSPTQKTQKQTKPRISDPDKKRKSHDNLVYAL